jgi:hypothetical protein
MISPNRSRGLACAALLGVAAQFGLSTDAGANEHERREEVREHRDFARDRHEFRIRDVHRFGPEELALWRGGAWRNSCFGGRCGWWWFAGGQWYFYDHPVYPYPLVVSEVAFVEPVALAPVATVAPLAPVAPPPPQAQVYYYCDNPPGYYPSVPSCPTHFRPVPAPAPPR